MTKDWKIDIPKEYVTEKTYYLIDGKKFYRVTSTLSIIAKHSLMQWMARVGVDAAKKKMESRQQIGTHVHNLIELTLKDDYSFNLNEYDPEVKLDIELFNPFRRDCDLKPEGLEQKVRSAKYGYAGTADFIGGYTSNEKYLFRGHKPKFPKGARIVGDWKTSSNLYWQNYLQLAAYLFAFKEMTGIKLDGGVLVHIRNGRIKVKEKTYDELAEEFEVYKAVLIVYERNYKKGVN